MTTLDAIARPSGAFAMVAMDQRESLRHMFDLAGHGRPADDVLIDFKVAVAEELGPYASGFLADRQFGFDRVSAAVPSSTGIILAVDALDQADGGPVEDTALDEEAIAAIPGGVVALKLLLIWRRDERRAARVALASRFIEVARENGVLSVLEPVVRAAPDEADFDTDAAIREAARELAALRPDLYKAQVPMAGGGDEAAQRAASAELNACMTGPWVVLSQGVERDRFAPAVRAACLEGASGFLAGRALWSDVVGSVDIRGELRSRSVDRLKALGDIVDEAARPWREAAKGRESVEGRES
jgi:sulfofructosephosphate aldolase